MTKKLLVSVVIFMALAGAAWAGQPVTETRPLAADGVVAIENMAGSITVTGWSENRVEVTATLSEEAEKLEVEGDASRLKVRVDMKRGVRTMGDSHLEVRVPATCRLDVEGVASDIAVAGVGGRLDLESVSGTVDVKGTPSALEIETVSGNVTVETAPDRATAESVSGDITVQRVSGELEAASVSGEIEVLDGTLTGGEIATTSCDIRIATDLAGHGSLSVESMSGTVVLALPAHVSADFEIATFSGDIHNELGPQAERTSEFTPGKELRFTAGSGGPRVKVESFSGSVKIETR